MVLVVLGFLLWDYTSEWEVHLSERREALQGEAESLLSATRLRDEPDAVLQRYIDDVCARMRETSSPGHYIALVLGDRVFQTTAHRRPAQGLVADIQAAARRPNGLGESAGESIVVAAAHRDGASLFVSEYVTDIRRVLRTQVLRRTLSILALGLVLGAVVNLLVRRLVTRPLGAVVEAVRKISRGELGVQTPAAATGELAFLADEFNAMSSALADAEEERRRRMERARRIQQHLIPSDSAGLGLRVASIFHPAEVVAGDYFDIRQTDSGAVIFCVADVSGHGVPAALLAAMLKALFASACAAAEEPRRILASINDQFAAVTLDEDFASAIVVAVDRDGGRISYASAGHEPAVLTRKGADTVILSATGPPLGVRQDVEWEQVAFETTQGDRLVMVTDGLPELSSPTGEMFGRRRLQSLLEQNRDQPLHILRGRILETLAAHGGDSRPADDVTVLAVDL